MTTENMTDRELLELAAKAFGLSEQWPLPDYELEITGSGIWCSGMGNGELWNPLTDDGDALRLAVNLNLLILPYPDDNAVRVTRLDLPDTIVSFGTPPDPIDATRRAITLAAAEIGKEMP